MKRITITATFRTVEEIEVPDDFDWDGTIESLLEYTDLGTAGASLVDWEVEGPGISVSLA